MRIFSLNVAPSGAFGMSMHAPVVSNFQPWYTHRSPNSSLRPKNIPAPRCGQRSSTIPTLPPVSR